MKFKEIRTKICSLGMILCIMFNTCTIVRASDVVPANEMESVLDLNNDSYTILSTEEMERIVESNTEYSALTEQEKEQISDEYLVNKSVMEECEMAGYSLSESIELAKIFQNIDLTPDQFEKMADNFGDREAALQQAKKFANFRYTYPLFEMENDVVCIEYLVSGIYANDILKARAIAAFLEMNINEISDFTYADDGSNDISYIADIFNVKRNILEEYIENSEKTEEEFVEEIINNFGRILIKTGDAPSIYSTEEEYEYNPQFPPAPFTYSTSNGEVINEQTGALRYEKIGAVIPGKNGLDLTIGVRYNSDDSTNREMTTDISGIGNITLSNYTVKRKMYSPLCMFSNGWDFMFSYIRYYMDDFDAVYSSFVDNTGAIRSIRSSDVADEECEEIALYNGYITLEDVKLYKDSSYTDNEVTSLFCVKYKDGTKEYFDEQGKLMKTENRFGDFVTYRYYTTGTEINYHSQIYNKVEITDTLGQIITIEKSEQENEYDESGVEIHIQPMIVTLPDGESITYRIRGSQHYKNFNDTDYAQVLDSITDQEGMTTSFEYIENDVSKFNYLDPFNYESKERAFYPITAIVHPTGIRTEYVYEHANGKLVRYGNTYQYYRLLERKETDGTDDFNKVTYTYNGDYTNVGGMYTVYSTNSEGLVTEKSFQGYGSVYRKYRLKTSERTYYMDGDTEVNVSKIGYADYYERTYPQTITEYVYNQDGTRYLCTTEKYEYDIYGDCIKYWDAHANGDTTNTENLTTYAYDSEYHYLNESIYKTNADTTIREVYTPSEDHKKIIDKSIYMNDNLVSKTGFTYAENSGFPATQTEYRSTTEGDSVTTSFEYLNNTFKTRETTNGNSINYAYDIYGNILSQTDAKGNATHYEYDGLSRQIKVTYSDNTEEQTTYTLQNSSNGVINRVTTIAQNGAVTEYNYDLLGKIINVKDLTLGVTNEIYEYDGMGRISKIIYPNNTYTTYTYDISDRVTGHSICEADGTIRYTKAYTYEDAFDENTSKVTVTLGSGSDAGKTAQYIDKYGNMIREDLGDTGKLSESKRYTYDYKGNLVSEIFRTAETAEDEIRSNTIVESVANNGVKTITKDYYNNEAIVYTNMSGQESKTVDGNGHHIYSSYDASGRLAAKSANLGSALSVTYYTYDANGNIIKESITDNKPGETETLRNTYMEYDCMNRLVRSWSDEEGETRYTYDSLGNILTMITGITESEPQGNTTTYEYDSKGRLIKTIDPMGKTETYTYDVMGNLATTTDRNGTVITNTYNAINKVIKNSAVNGQTTDTISYTYTNGGLVKNVARSESNISYTYNQKGQVTNETTSGLSAAAKNYTYDNYGNVSRVAVSNGASVYDMSYVYNPMSQMVTATDNIINKTVASYEYDAAGNVSKETLANGVITTYAYNELNALSSVTNKKDSNVISSYSYSYYLDGNRSGVTENNGRVQSFVYDKNGRLSSETDSMNGQTVITSYAYDRFGNRVSSTTTGAEVSNTTYTYDENNRLLSKVKNTGSLSLESQYTYDNNGNLVRQINSSYADDEGWGESTNISVCFSGGAQDVSDALLIFYEYDLRNKLTGVQTDNGLNAEYVYDATEKRVKKTVNDTTTSYIWNNDNIIYENGTQNVRYSYAMGLAGMKVGTEDYYYISNGHGDITQLTNSLGEVAESYAYDAFGNQRDTEYSVYNPFRYCGEYYDEESGLLYLRNRYYDASTGRFITEDPARDGLNWYVYCDNNPINRIDPSGLEYLVVSGSEEDSRYKYNFVETAIKKINDLKALNDGEWITWIVSKTAYSNDAVQAMNDIAYNMGVGFVTIESASEFQNYVNSQNKSNWELSQRRLADPIRKAIFFSHGVEGAVELGYGQSNRESLSINSTIVGGMFKNAFDSPNTWFYSCNGATGGENSIAKQWYNIAGGFTGAYIGKTTYEYIMYPQNYSSIKKLWNKEMRQTDANIDERRSDIGFSKTGSDYYPIPSKGTTQYTWGW